MDSYSYYIIHLVSNKLASRTTFEGLKSKIFLGGRGGGMHPDPPTAYAFHFYVHITVNRTTSHSVATALLYTFNTFRIHEKSDQKLKKMLPNILLYMDMDTHKHTQTHTVEPL